MTMLRFVRARKGSVEKAAEMYRSAMKWKAANGLEQGFRSGAVDDALHRRFDRHWKAIGLLGRDREGAPILWERVGTVDAATMSPVSVDFLERHEVYTMTRIL